MRSRIVPVSTIAAEYSCMLASSLHIKPPWNTRRCCMRLLSGPAYCACLHISFNFRHLLRWLLLLLLLFELVLVLLVELRLLCVLLLLLRCLLLAGRNFGGMLGGVALLGVEPFRLLLPVDF